MKFKIIKSAEGFDVLTPDVLFYREEFRNMIVLNDTDAAQIPWLCVGLNMTNPSGRGCIWVYGNGFSESPLGLRKLGFSEFNARYRTIGDASSFEVESAAELITLYGLRYGNDWVTAETRQALTDWVNAVMVAYADIDLDSNVTSDTKAEQLYAALSSTADASLAYIGRDLFKGALQSVDISKSKVSSSCWNLLEMLDSDPLSVDEDNVLVTLSDAEYLFKLFLLSFVSSSSAAVKERYNCVIRLLALFADTSTRVEIISLGESILKDYGKSLGL